MELSQFTDYSLRSLIYLGLRREEGLTSVREIADAYDISQHHLVKVVHNLAKLGYVSTFRGRGGGLSLALSPEEINVGQIVRQTENLGLVECMTSGGKCCLTNMCTLQHALGEAKDAFIKTLDSYFLSDLIAPQAKLRQALSLSHN